MVFIHSSDKLRRFLANTKINKIEWNTTVPQTTYLIKNTVCSTLTRLKVNNFQKTTFYFNKTFNRLAHHCCKCDNIKNS